MQENYRLIGILNLFDVIPSFVYLIFERDNQYYFIIGDFKGIRDFLWTFEMDDRILEKEIKKFITITGIKH